MNFSKLFLAFTIISLSAQMPVQAAGLKSKALVGAFAAAGSALATGAIELAKQFKYDAEARARIAELESDLNWHVIRDKMNDTYKDGLFVGSFLTFGVAWIIILAILDSKYSATADAQDKDLVNTDKQEAIKA